MVSVLNYYPLLTEKKIPLNLLNVHSRVYFNWKKEGLLNETVNEDENDPKRRKVFLNVFDALWILIIKELRNLNIDLKTILELKKFLFSLVKLDNEKIAQLSKEEFIDSILENIPLEYQEAVRQEFAEKSIETLIDMIDEEMVIAFKYIGSLLTDVLLLHKAVSLVIIKEKASSELDFIIVKNNSNATVEEKNELYEIYSKHLSNDILINIPILSLVNKLFEDENLEKYCVGFGLFNPNEKKLLKALHDDSCKKITILGIP